MVLTKCISKDGEGGNGPVKQVLYDYEFIEDYCNPNETTIPAASATQGIPLSAVSSQSEPPANDDELWWLIEDEVEDDFDGKMESEPSDPPCWGPQEYSPQYHPLTLMVGLLKDFLIPEPTYMYKICTCVCTCSRPILNQ